MTGVGKKGGERHRHTEKDRETDRERYREGKRLKLSVCRVFITSRLGVLEGMVGREKASLF